MDAARWPIYHCEFHIRQHVCAVVKRLPELALASLLSAAAAPAIILASLFVRLTSRGPAFYLQRRMGLRGKCFTLYKLRTMCRDSEPHGPRWCVRGDKRVTPVGRFLRWTHLDELPQLINVLQGEMRLIGPRPERPEIVAELERAIPDYPRRLEVRPGITGLAQVLCGPDTGLASVRRKLKLDLYYLENPSFWMDLRILLATPLHVFRVPPLLIARAFGFPVELLQPPDGVPTVNLGLTSTISEPCGDG